MILSQAIRQSMTATMLTLALAVPGASAEAQQTTRAIAVVVDGVYTPDRIEVQEGERIQLELVRNDAGPCTREVVFPQLNIRRELLSDKTIIELPALGPGEYEFKCGMNMARGKLVVVARKP